MPQTYQGVPATLALCTGLRSLQLGYGDYHLGHMTQLTALTHIDVACDDLPAEHLPGLAACTGLASLALEFMDRADGVDSLGSLSFVEQLTGLTSLEIAYLAPGIDINIHPLERLQRLQRLTLKWMDEPSEMVDEIDLLDLRPLGSLPLLQVGLLPVLLLAVKRASPAGVGGGTPEAHGLRGSA